MEFDVEMPNRLATWSLRAAGIDIDAFSDMYSMAAIGKLPMDVVCPYFLAEPPIDVRITLFSFGLTNHLKIAVDDPGTGTRIKEKMEHYSVKNNGLEVSDREHKELFDRVDRILSPDGTNSENVQRDKVVLTRRAIEELMRLCEEIEHGERHSVLWQFTCGQFDRQDRVFVAKWLIRRFEIEKDPCVRSDIGTVFLNHRDLVVREISNDLIRMIRDPRFGVSRSGLIDILPKTRHPQAAEVIASVMDHDRLAWSSLRGLGCLKAKPYADQIRRYLRHPDSEVRREAKKAMKKIGLPVETQPTPIHLIKNRRYLPKGLEEWSTNLDFDNLSPVLNALAGCVDGGFGQQEIAEVIGVAEEMRVNQTKVFCFPIMFKGEKGDIWLIIFMDDIDSPDTEIHAHPALIEEFEIVVNSATLAMPSCRP